jgi:hypothetical protein
MNASSLLHPTVQRFILDENCLFLLCSDGLSDNDRVEQHWQTELLPVLEGKIDVATASQRLVAIANTENGHDNVTVGLIHCQVNYPAFSKPLDPALANPPNIPGDLNPNSGQASSFTTAPTRRTKILRRRRSFNPFPFLLGVAGIVAVGGLVVLAIPELRSRIAPAPTAEPSPSVDLEPSPTPSPILSPPSPAPPLTVGSLIQVNQRATLAFPPFTTTQI